jgi:hypothetical protein
MIKFGISEILKAVSDTEDYDKKIGILRKNDSPVFRHILRLAFTPGVKWLLPEGKPKIKYNDLPGQQGNLFAEWRRFYLFFPGGNDNLPDKQREAIFSHVLESLDPKDADLICYIKDGIMPYESVTAALIHDAFPGLLPEETKPFVEVAAADIPPEVIRENVTLALDEAVLATLSKDDITAMEKSGFRIIIKSKEPAAVVPLVEPSVETAPITTPKKKATKTKNG